MDRYQSMARGLVTPASDNLNTWKVMFCLARSVKTAVMQNNKIVSRSPVEHSFVSPLFDYFDALIKSQIFSPIFIWCAYFAATANWISLLIGKPSTMSKQSSPPSHKAGAPHLIAPTLALPEAVLPQTQGKSACLIFHTIHEGWLQLCVLDQQGQLTVPLPQQAPVIDVCRAWGEYGTYYVYLSTGGPSLPHHLYQSTHWWATHLLWSLFPIRPQWQSLSAPFIPWSLAGPCSTSSHPPLATRGPDPALTNDDCPVICNEHLAMDIDEL